MGYNLQLQFFRIFDFEPGPIYLNEGKLFYITLITLKTDRPSFFQGSFPPLSVVMPIYNLEFHLIYNILALSADKGFISRGIWGRNEALSTSFSNYFTDFEFWHCQLSGKLWFYLGALHRGYPIFWPFLTNPSTHIRLGKTFLMCLERLRNSKQESSI